MFWIILIVILILIIIILLISLRQNKKLEKKTTWENECVNELKFLGTYVGGHPDQNESVSNCYVLRKDENLEFYRKLMVENPVYLFSIKIARIKDIKVEDMILVKQRIDNGELVLVGDFAAVWEKKQTEAVSFLCINWMENGYKHKTAFYFEGTDAYQQANVALNDLIRFNNNP